jgi:phosphoadenosine phosphosulfate reductase
VTVGRNASMQRSEPLHPAFASPDVSYELLERAHPRDILRWAARSIERLAVATSFQSSGLVILHLLQSIRPGLPVLFLNTGFHFDETLAFKERIANLWDLNLVELHGEHGTVEEQEQRHGPKLFQRDPDKCCFINKVEPLQRALKDYDGWISGLRRDQSPLRASTPIVEAQMLATGDEILKIHPLAGWTRDDVDAYQAEFEIPTHPLLELGYSSIGCWPCTKPVGSNNGDERAGRWEGFDKTECGIHSFGHSRESEAEQ